MRVESFQGYGSTWIKSAVFSPDAYVQMAIQLASYRLFGKQVGTYESTQVRAFLHGRTEATRSVSPASHAFVESMGLEPGNDNRETRTKKMDLLRYATESHVDYIRKAARGQGVDRHFFGLSMVVQPGEKSPSLYSHPLYARSKQWRVSTST
jgi:carnitine O-acetyltransferase